MFGNGEAPPTATVSPMTKAVGPIIDRLWSRAPRSGAIVPSRPVPASSGYPRPTRPLGWVSMQDVRTITDPIIRQAFGDWGYAGAAGALAFSFVVGFLFGRSTR